MTAQLIIAQSTVDAARNGDREALSVPVESTLPAMKRFARRHCPVSEMEDAVQDAVYYT